MVVYPEYYSTWENPSELIPFTEAFFAAKDNDQKLYNDLAQLIVRSNYAYTMNPNRLSAYYSALLTDRPLHLALRQQLYTYLLLRTVIETQDLSDE